MVDERLTMELDIISPSIQKTIKYMNSLRASMGKVNKEDKKRSSLVKLLTNINEKHNKSLLTKMFYFNRIYFFTNVLVSSFQRMSQTLVKLEGDFLRGNAVLQRYGESINPILEQMQSSFGFGRVSAGSALSNISDQLINIGIEGQQAIGILSGVGEATAGISGITGMTFKESSKLVSEVLSGNFFALRKIGATVDFKGMTSLTPQQQALKGFDEMMKFIRNADTKGLYLNKKTIAQQAETTTDMFRDIFFTFYQRLGSERLGSGFGLINSLIRSFFNKDNVAVFEKMVKSFNNIFVWMEQIGKSGGFKDTMEILGKTVSFLASWADRILVLYLTIKGIVTTATTYLAFLKQIKIFYAWLQTTRFFPYLQGFIMTIKGLSTAKISFILGAYYLLLNVLDGFGLKIPYLDKINAGLKNLLDMIDNFLSRFDWYNKSKEWVNTKANNLLQTNAEWQANYKDDPRFGGDRVAQSMAGSYNIGTVNMYEVNDAKGFEESMNKAMVSRFGIVGGN